jgi:hypothetical protein
LIYLNPTNNSITIELPHRSLCDIQIVNQLGQTIYIKNKVEIKGAYKFDLRNQIPKGEYNLQIVNETHKILKEKLVLR